MTNDDERAAKRQRIVQAGAAGLFFGIGAYTFVKGIASDRPGLLLASILLWTLSVVMIRLFRRAQASEGDASGSAGD